MSTFGWSNITGIDDFTSTGGSGLPGGINGSIQYNDLGTDFAGVSNFIYDDNTSTMSVVNVDCDSLVCSGNVGANTLTAVTTVGCATVNATTVNGTTVNSTNVNGTTMTATGTVHASSLQSTTANVSAIATLNTIINTNSASFANQVYDSTNSAGVNGQFLKSTGSATLWSNLPTPAPFYPSRVFASNTTLGGAIGVNATATLIIQTVHFANGFTNLPPPTLFIEISNTGRYAIEVGVTIFCNGPGDATAVLKNIGTIASVATTFQKTHTIQNNHYAHLSDSVVFDFNAGDQYGVQLTSLNAAVQYSQFTLNIYRVG